MSDYWNYGEPEYEPEPVLELKKEAASFNVELLVNSGLIEQAVKRHIDEMLEERIKKLVADQIKLSLKDLLKKDAWSDKSLEAMMQKEVSKRLNELYPEVVENKVNEFEEEIKKLKFGSRNNNYSLEHLAKTAQERVSEADKKAHDIINNYLENELKESVKLSKEYIEQFAKNYFANNLFRAMGMMDKMLPQTESMRDGNA